MPGFTRRVFETSREVPLRPWDRYYVEAEAKDLLRIVINSRAILQQLKSVQQALGSSTWEDGDPIPPYFVAMRGICEAIGLAKRSESQAHLSLYVNFGYDSNTIFDDFVPYWW